MRLMKSFGTFSQETQYDDRYNRRGTRREMLRLCDALSLAVIVASNRVEAMRQLKAREIRPNNFAEVRFIKITKSTQLTLLRFNR